MIASVIVSGKILDNIIHKKHTRVKDRFWWGPAGDSPSKNQRGQSFKMPYLINWFPPRNHEQRNQFCKFEESRKAEETFAKCTVVVPLEEVQTGDSSQLSLEGTVLRDSSSQRKKELALNWLLALWLT